MTKIVLQDIASLTNEIAALAALNSNSAIIETVSDNFLSRDGTTPNQMNADFDMNSNNILNLPSPASANEPLRLQDLSDFIGGGTIVAGVRRPLTGTSTDNAVMRWDGTAGDRAQNSGIIVDDTNNITGVTSLITPLIIGGAAVSSILTLESTSGAGTSDKISIKTGSQIESLSVETIPGSNTFTLASGSKPGMTVIRAGSTLSGTNIFTTPGIGPAPSAGLLFVEGDYADSTAGNISNIFAVAYNLGTRFTAAVTGIGVLRAGTVGGNAWGGQFSAIALGNAGGILQGANIEVDYSTGAVTGIPLTLKLGDSAGGVTVNPGNCYINMLSDTGKTPQTALRFQASAINSANTQAVLGLEGGSAVNGIDLSLGTFTGNSFKSKGFSVTDAGVVQIGTATSILGTIKLSGNTSGTVTINPASAAGTYSITLPSALPASTAAMVTTTAGVHSYSTSVNTGHGSQLITSSTTFTPATGVYAIYAEAWGGGGGGGRYTGVGTVPGSGGGSGGYSAAYITTTPGTGITATIGAAGTGSTGANAGTGGTTTFSPLSAVGGTGGGDNGGGPGAGGTASGGTLNIAGKSGFQPTANTQTWGGDAPRGGAGGLTGIDGGAAQTGVTPGGGGGGASHNGGAAQNGAAGATGAVMVWW